MLAKFNQSGFSFIQVLLVLALFMVMASLTIPSLYQLQTGVQIDTVAAEIGQNLRRAQTKAMTGLNNSAWGVYFADHSYIIFSGDSYESREPDWDEDYLVSAGLTMVNDLDEEVVFSKISGQPDSTGEITLSTFAGEIVSITINSQGAIEYR